MMHINHFFALKLPLDVKKYIQIKTNEIKKNFPFKKWVHPDDYHITLAFLGSVETEKLENAVQRVRNICGENKSFKLRLSEMGTFGPSNAPRILWAGVKNESGLLTLQKGVYDSCIEAGFMLDKKPFKPHITAARKFTGQQFNTELLPSLGDYSFDADTVTLYKTNMGKSPSYETIYDFHLNTIE